MIKLYDRAYIKSQNTTGFVVDIIEESHTVEKEENAGPICWNFSLSDRVPVGKTYKKTNMKRSLVSHRKHD